MNINFIHIASVFVSKLYSDVKIDINECKYKMLMIQNDYRNFFLFWL